MENQIVELTATEVQEVEGGFLPLLAAGGYYAFCLGSSYAVGFGIGTAINRMIR